MSLNISCDGQHEHAPWSINNGVFDTSLEAEYTPCLAKALATAILEGISGQYKLLHVAQHAKKLKPSLVLPSQLKDNPPERFSFP